MSAPPPAICSSVATVSPECLVPNVSFTQKWAAVMALPLAVLGLLCTMHVLRVAYNVLSGRKRGASCRKQLAHAVTVKSASLLLFYVLYLYLVRTVLDVFDCVPTTPPDGQLYMAAVFVPCGVPGGLQVSLVPWAALGIVVYVIGYPAFLVQVR